MSPPFSGPRPFSVARASSRGGARGGFEVGEVNALVYGTEEPEVKVEEVVTEGSVSSVGVAGTGFVDGQPGPEAGTAAVADVVATGRRKTNSPGKDASFLCACSCLVPPPPRPCFVESLLLSSPILIRRFVSR